MNISQIKPINPERVRPHSVGNLKGLDLFPKYTPLNGLNSALKNAGIRKLHVDGEAKFKLESGGARLSLRISNELSNGRELSDILQSYLHKHGLEATFLISAKKSELVIVGNQANINIITANGSEIVNPKNLIRGLAISPGMVLEKVKVIDDSNAASDFISAEAAEKAVNGSAYDVKQQVELIHLAFDALADKFSNMMELPGQAGVDADTMATFLIPAIREDVAEHIGNGLSPVKACEMVFEPMKPLLKSTDNKRRDDAISVFGILTKVLAYRYGVTLGVRGAIKSGEKVIIIGKNFDPVDAAEISSLGRGIVVGIATEGGSEGDHLSNIAEGLGIPFVGQAKGIMGKVKRGDNVLVDGLRGIAIINPTEEQGSAYGVKFACYSKSMDIIGNEIGRKPVTKDGLNVAIRGNVQSVSDAVAIMATRIIGGFGLVRTEYFYGVKENGNARLEEPSVEEQADYYIRVMQIANGLPVTFRVIDVAGDKYLKYISKPESINLLPPPQGMDLLLDKENHRAYYLLFRRQMKAFLIASAKAEENQMRVMLPNVSALKQVSEVRKIINELQKELDGSGIKYGVFELGAMVENKVFIRSLINAEEENWKNLKKAKPDFLSIGSTDLTQDVLGINRYDGTLSDRFDSLHPNVIRWMKEAGDFADRNNIPISICGKVASNPIAIPLLIGLGFYDLSMSASKIPLGIHLIRNITLRHSMKLAQELEALQTSEERMIHIISRTKHFVREGRWSIQNSIIDYITGEKL